MRAHLLPLIVLFGCGVSEPVAPPAAVDVEPGASATQLAPNTSLIVFDRAFTTPTPTSEPVRGGRVRVQFDRQRFYDIVDGEHQLGYFATTFHCYGYGCCEVTTPEAFVHFRFGPGPFSTRALDAQDGADLEIPATASGLELYFDVPGFSVRTWYCGCDTQCSQDNYARASGQFHAHATYDSRFGENYLFSVGDPRPEPQGVARIADGQWQSNWDAPSGVRYGWFWDANVWVDVAVENLAFHKDVGIRWTVDGWATHTDTPAVYEHDLGEGWEQWGVDLAATRLMDCFNSCTVAPVTFEYAIFYEVDGETYWDNNGGENHVLAIDTEYQ